MEPADEHLLIVSDLHLGCGLDTRSQTYDRLDDFFYDYAFDRFVGYHIATPPNDGDPWHLIILGDFIDFWQIEHEEGAGYTSTVEADCVKKLQRAVKGHPEIFDALARLVAHGHKLTIVVGNHDVEFAWPGVQCALRKVIFDRLNEDPALCVVVDNARSAVENRIVFCEWIFYRQGLIYAEHGHQYEQDTAVLTHLWPWEPDQIWVDDKRNQGSARATTRNPFPRKRSVLAAKPQKLQVPLGQDFVNFVFNRVEWIDPFSDNLKPPSRYFGGAVRAKPTVALLVLVSYVGTLLTQLVLQIKFVWRLRLGDPARQREDYHEAWQPNSGHRLAEIVGRIGLPIEALIRIDSRLKLSVFPYKLLQAGKQIFMLALISLIVVILLAVTVIGLGALLAAFAVFSLHALFGAPELRFTQQLDAAADWFTALSPVDWIFDRVSDLASWIGDLLQKGLGQVLLVLVLVWIVAWLARTLPWLKSPRQHRAQPQNYLRDAALAIHGMFKQCWPDLVVPVYVFGHTHVAERYPLEKGDDPPVYINSGSWTPILPASTEIVRGREILTFVHVERDYVRLRVWNDNADRPESLREQELGTSYAPPDSCPSQICPRT